jgi:hypothetical protein
MDDSIEGVYLPSGIYAQYNDDDMPAMPNPCRKYHISSDVGSAREIANIALPYLAQRRINHKVVRDFNYLVEQTLGEHSDQAGKFITVYMDAGAALRNDVVEELNRALGAAKGIRPCPYWPTRRLGRNGPNDTRVYEAVVNANRHGAFIYGGFICDPME